MVKLSNERKHFLLIMLTFAGITGLVYWRVLSLPFITDDWWYVRMFQTNEIFDLIRYYFNPTDKYVYRPLGEVSMGLSYLFFGFDPSPMHWFGLFTHIVNCLLIFLILENVLENRIVACLSAIVYASGVAVHLEIFAWAWATYYDIGAIFFLLFSIWFYLKDRWLLSLLTYLLGCLFKPLAVLLPILLVFHSVFLSDKQWREIFSIRFLIRWIPFALVGGLAIGLKFIVSDSKGIGDEGAYAIEFWGKHLISNGFKYLTWMFQALIPFYKPHLPFYRIIAILALLIFLAGTLITLISIRRDKAFFKTMFLLIWSVVGLLPAVFLPNHTYRYYATFSLPAFLALFFYAIHYLLLYMKVSLRGELAVFFLFGCLAVGGSFIQSGRIFTEEINQNTFSDGTNLLFRRSATQVLVSEKLKKDFPTLPSGLVIVLVNADLGSFGFDNSALQYLFNDNSFEVLPPSAISYENGDWFFTTPDSAPQYLDPSLVVVYELIENDIVRRDLDDLVQPENVP